MVRLVRSEVGAYADHAQFVFVIITNILLVTSLISLLSNSLTTVGALVFFSFVLLAMTDSNALMSR